MIRACTKCWFGNWLEGKLLKGSMIGLGTWMDMLRVLQDMGIGIGALVATGASMMMRNRLENRFSH